MACVMSVNEQRAILGRRRERGTQLIIAAAAIIFAAIVVSGVLAVGYAIPGFAIVALVCVLALRLGEDVWAWRDRFLFPNA